MSTGLYACAWLLGAAIGTLHLGGALLLLMVVLIVLSIVAVEMVATS